MRAERKTVTKNGIVRLVFAALAVVSQIYWIYAALAWLDESYTWISMIVQVLALLLVMYIYGTHMDASMKMPWVVLIMVAPLLGSILWFLMGRRDATARMRARFQKIDAGLMPILDNNPQVQEELKAASPDPAGIAWYLSHTCCFPLYRAEDVTYYPEAVQGLEAQLEDLAKAEHFIFMEYHAIEDKESFARIRAILKQKAAEGVDVRVFYDDIGSIGFLNGSFIREMEADGIRCRVFNRVIPVLAIFMNNRDHRKITVIDGTIAFTGGYNLANEYFGVTHPYGHWKDTGVRLTGACVRSFTVLFLEMWNAIHQDDADDEDFEPYFPEIKMAKPGKGFVQPYADSPLDEEHTGENVYLNVANQAHRYAYYITPYLIITDEMNRALTLAARRGVDVRIITPGIPDKKITYAITRSYYRHLADKGVRIFEYAPGFCHAKMCVSDDVVATCGTINLDYRSLYHHFENGCVLYDCSAVQEIRDDFRSLFPQCREVTEHYATHQNAFMRIVRCVLRLIAPLL